jgi:hypothetical protein
LGALNKELKHKAHDTHSPPLGTGASSNQSRHENQGQTQAGHRCGRNAGPVFACPRLTRPEGQIWPRAEIVGERIREPETRTVATTAAGSIRAALFLSYTSKRQAVQPQHAIGLRFSNTWKRVGRLKPYYGPFNRNHGLCCTIFSCFEIV